MSRVLLKDKILKSLSENPSQTYRELSESIGAQYHSVKMWIHRNDMVGIIKDARRSTLTCEQKIELRNAALRRCDAKNATSKKCEVCFSTFMARKRSLGKYCSIQCSSVGAGRTRSANFIKNDGITAARKKAALGSKARKESVKRLLTDSKQLARFQSQMESWMTWENRGKKTWHVDHRIALANFDLNDPIDWARATDPNNLQPLEAKENHRKSAK